jgi:small GTP-binding protein
MKEDSLEVNCIEQDINPEFCFKLVMLGDSGVGKTSLVKYEINNSFVCDRDSTLIFEHSFKNFSILGKNVRLQIWDTCGQEEYHSSLKNFYRSALCIIVVFSLESLDSFYKVNEWIEEINNNNSEDSILVLIGNKLDLTQPRVIDKELIEDYCKKIGIDNYFEASAKTGENVHDIFKQIVKQLFIKYAMPIINDNNEIKDEENNITSHFKKNFFNESTANCCKSCFCYNQ